MDEKEDGGAVFPMQFADGSLQVGLTLRDLIAMTAMSELIAAAAVDGTVDYTESVLADSAYLMADAMLIARAKK